MARDLIPWLNVGAGWRRLTGDTSRGDEDIVSFLSKDGGARDSNPTFKNGVFSTQGEVKPGWEDNGKGGYSQVAKTEKTTQEKTPPPVQDQNLGGLQIDPAYAAMMRQQALEDQEARDLREGILGRRSEVQSILDAILGNIDAELGEAKSRRTGQFNRDVDSLVGTLDEAIPDIENAFAAMGLTNSTYKGDRVQDTRDSYGKSYEDTNRQLNEDLTGFQKNAAGQKTMARTDADKMFGAFKDVEKMEGNRDNLAQLREFNSNSRNALADFKGEKGKFMPGGQALKAISALESDYDFGKTLDTFNTFASSNANPTSGGGVSSAAAPKGQLEKDKKNKTEVQINNPVGAASA